MADQEINLSSASNTDSYGTLFITAEETDLDTFPAANEVIVNETIELYGYHLMHEITERGLSVPTMLTFNNQNVEQRNVNILRRLADQFGGSPQRQSVYEQAHNVQLDTLNFNTFQDLLVGLFQEGGITWERVLVLFYFCTDLSIRALEEKLIEYFSLIYYWTTYYISRHLSFWIEQQGGWGTIILQQSVNHVAHLSFLGFCCVGIVALCIYIKNHLHNK